MKKSRDLILEHFDKKITKARRIICKLQDDIVTSEKMTESAISKMIFVRGVLHKYEDRKVSFLNKN